MSAKVVANAPARRANENWQKTVNVLHLHRKEGISTVDIAKLLLSDLEYEHEYSDEKSRLTAATAGVGRLLSYRAESEGFFKDKDGKWYGRRFESKKQPADSTPALNVAKGLEIKGPVIDVEFRRQRQFRNVAFMEVLDAEKNWTKFPLLGSVCLIILPANEVELRDGQSQLDNAIKICIVEVGLEPVELLVEKDEVVILQPL